jgi:hypothetical protein
MILELTMQAITQAPKNGRLVLSEKAEMQPGRPANLGNSVTVSLTDPEMVTGFSVNKKYRVTIEQIEP